MYDKFDVVVHPVAELRGTVTAQPSKNYTTRYLIAAALSGGETLVQGVATSENPADRASRRVKGFISISPEQYLANY